MRDREGSRADPDPDFRRSPIQGPRPAQPRSRAPRPATPAGSPRPSRSGSRARRSAAATGGPAFSSRSATARPGSGTRRTRSFPARCRSWTCTMFSSASRTSQRRSTAGATWRRPSPSAGAAWSRRGGSGQPADGSKPAGKAGFAGGKAGPMRKKSRHAEVYGDQGE